MGAALLSYSDMWNTATVQRSEVKIHRHVNLHQRGNTKYATKVKYQVCPSNINCHWEQDFKFSPISLSMRLAQTNLSFTHTTHAFLLSLRLVGYILIFKLTMISNNKQIVPLYLYCAVS